MVNENKTYSIEERYQSMSEIEHILQRAEMYIGNLSIDLITTNLYKPSENRIVLTENVQYCAGLIKIIDEVLTNSVDERRRKTRLFNITEITCKLKKDGTVIIRDNGGIPVVKHKTENIWLTHFLFGKLRTSGNYNQEIERTGAGLNGIGCKIANIFSSYFEVETCDGKNKIVNSWKNNMQELTEETITPVKNGEHYTQFKFKIELNRFNQEELNLHIYRLIQKRCIDAAASNLGLTVNFECDFEQNGENVLNGKWLFHSFSDFVKLHLSKDELKNNELLHQQGIDEFIITRNLGFDSYGFINGTTCSRGSHIDKITKQFYSEIQQNLKNQNIDLITDKDIKSKITVFANVQINNPVYDSQTKTNLVSKIHQDKLKLNKQFVKSISNCQILQDMIDYYQVKFAAELKKQTRKLNNLIKQTKSTKHIGCVNKNSKNKELFIFEGESASGGFLKHRNPQTQEAYKLRGKILNTLNLDKTRLLENQELREIIAVLKLQFDDASGNIKNCPFDKIIIATDMDYDGHHICGLMITFFGTFFPELLKAGKIHRLMTPIIEAVNDKTKKSLYYYNLVDFNMDNNSSKLKNYTINYKKGLGSLEDKDYREMLNNTRLLQFEIGKTYKETIKVWFDKNTEMRKELLLQDINEE